MSTPAYPLRTSAGGTFFQGRYYLWRSKFDGMSVPDAKRLKELETEDNPPKTLLADSLLENEVTREFFRRVTRSLGERRALTVLGSSG